MFYCFVFLLCLFIFSGTTVSTKNKVFYISGYNTSNAEQFNKTTVSYRYKNNEVLNLTCHMKHESPVPVLRWLRNEQSIRGVEDNTKENKLQYNITKSNDNDIFTCSALEDTNGLPENEKTVQKKISLILEYVGNEDTTTPAPDPIELKEKDVEENFFLKLSKSTLFWVIVVVFIVALILTTVVAFASKMSHRIKEDKVGLHPAVSDTSVFTTESRSPILSYHKIPEEKYYTNNTSTNKVGLNLTVSNASYLNTESRKPIIPDRQNNDVHFYTNSTYKSQLNTLREVIDSEYQEPIDSEAYCEPQMYSEPEKQVYAEPIPKNLRMKKDTAYVNYNKSNGSPNVKQEHIDLYQNCEDINNELYNYTEMC